jgi:hypothetical protein
VVWNKTGVMHIYIYIYIYGIKQLCVVSVGASQISNVRHWTTSTRGEPENRFRILTTPHIVQVLLHVILDLFYDLLEHWLCCKVQLYAAIGAAALLEFQHLESFVVLGETKADDLSNRDDVTFKASRRASRRALRFSNIVDLNLDILKQESVLRDVEPQPIV